MGDAFSDATLPSWAEKDAGLWAPDIRYVDGQYRLYYVVTQTTVTAERDDNAIGMATAPTPAGPWTDSGAPVVGPRRGGQVGDGNFLWTFDPAAVTDTDGSQWLFYGSYYGGLFTTRLSADGTRAVGTPVRVAIDNKFEGSYVVRRDGYWYLFASTANCCAGPTTGYSVQVGRSRTIQGPYVDQQGVSLTDSRAGGTPVLNQNGNRWVGAGHNAIATDLAGQDWIAYHAIDRGDPYLDGTDGINQRPMLLDRLDWVAGWPAVRAGQGPSEGAERAPVTTGGVSTTFSAGAPREARLVGTWQSGTDAQSGSYLRSAGAGAVLTRSSAPGDVRAEADLRSSGAAYGLVVSQHGQDATRLVIDPVGGTATLRQEGSGGGVRTAPLPAGFDAADWHAASLERRGGTVTAQLSNARLGDPVVDLRLALRPGAARAGQAGAVAAGAGVGVDNLSVVPAGVPVTRLAVEPVPHRLDPGASDEFDGSARRALLAVGAARQRGRRLRRLVALAHRGGRPDRQRQRRRCPPARSRRRGVDGRDQGQHRPRHRHRPQLPAGRAHRLRQRRPVHPVVARGHLEHPADGVRQGDALCRTALLRRHHRRAARGDDLAAADPPRRRPHRRARAARLEQPRRPHVGQGWRLDASGGLGGQGRAHLPRRGGRDRRLRLPAHLPMTTTPPITTSSRKARP